MIIKNLNKLGKNRKKEIDREAINEKSVNAKTLPKTCAAVTEDNAVETDISCENTKQK